MKGADRGPFFWLHVNNPKAPSTPLRAICTVPGTAGSSRSFTAIRKDAGLCCGSRLRKGEVFAYVGLPQNLKDLKKSRVDFWKVDTNCRVASTSKFVLHCTTKAPRIPTTEGRSVCLCWAKSKPKGPKGPKPLRAQGTHLSPPTCDGGARRFIVFPGCAWPGFSGTERDHIRRRRGWC